MIGQRSHDCCYLVGKGGPDLWQHAINIIWSKGLAMEELWLMGAAGTLLASLGVRGI